VSSAVERAFVYLTNRNVTTRERSLGPVLIGFFYLSVSWNQLHIKFEKYQFRRGLVGSKVTFENVSFGTWDRALVHRTLPLALERYSG
jgi:hypothetical protein